MKALIIIAIVIFMFIVPVCAGVITLNWIGKIGDKKKWWKDAFERHTSLICLTLPVGLFFGGIDWIVIILMGWNK